MPLQRRIPKRGFTNRGRVEYEVVNVRDLNRVEVEQVTLDVLVSSGLVGSGRKPIKILGMGELDKALHVEAHAFSGSAREKIEAAGGTISVAPRR